MQIKSPVYGCSACGRRFWTRVATSFYSSELEVRSDGQIQWGIFPPLPPLVLCPHCAAPIETIDVGPIAVYEGDPPDFSDAGYQFSAILLAEVGKGNRRPTFLGDFDFCYGYLNVSIEQLLTWVDTKVANESRYALASLLYTWRRINDEREGSNYTRAFTKLETKTLSQLVNALSRRDDERRVLLAEWYREIGSFEQSAELLGHNSSREYMQRITELLRAVMRKETKPFYFAKLGTGEALHFF